MARTEQTTANPRKRLVVLAIMVLALLGSLLVGTVTSDKNRFTPDLALDLEGGTQIILTPVTTDGSEITETDVAQAIEIIRQRVDASGVAEAEISSQGGNNIVVALPGQPTQETLDLVRTSAVLRLRPVLTTLGGGKVDAATISAIRDAEAAASASASASATPSESASATPSPSVTPTASAEPTPSLTLTPEELEAEIVKLADTNKDGKISDAPATTPANASDTAWVTEQVLYDAYKLDCTSADARLAAVTDDPAKPTVACEPDSGIKYILGPAEIEGTQITRASSSPAVNSAGQATGGWAVKLEFNNAGAETFADFTGRLLTLPSPRNLFAIVLDGQVISAASPSERIAGGSAQITGSFSADEASSLANQLKFGSLPLNFTVQSEEQISATLGTEQLRSGLIAGLIGLLLIVFYMVWQYHALGLVAVASILLATGLSYFVVSGLSWMMGYRLSMAGVLGLIISIGVTADSFIVFFERIRDEIREGRSLKGAVEHGWQRAKRTIIVSDFVNLLASVVLYMLTVGSVRGFAFTLGITTVLDLIVVMMFTYPVMTRLIKTSFFGEGKRFSGMDAKALGAVPSYRGRGRRLDGTPAPKATEASDVVEKPEATTTKAVKQPVAAGKVKAESLAERRARERREQKAVDGLADSGKDVL